MRDELQDKLNEDFPNLFRKGKSGQWGCRRCECSDGWHDIIREACERLTKLNIPELKFDQVKEKFGTLRMYTSIGGTFVGEIVRDAEGKSSITCEECGSTNGVKTAGRGWIQSLCPECRKKVDEKYDKDRLA